MVLLIFDNGATSATKKAFITKVWLNAIIYPSVQEEHPCRGDGDPTGAEANESRGNKAYGAGAKGEAGGAALCHVPWTWPIRQECGMKIM